MTDEQAQKFWRLIENYSDADAVDCFRPEPGTWNAQQRALHELDAYIDSLKEEQ